MIDLEQARKLGEAATSVSWEATHDIHQRGEQGHGVWSNRQGRYIVGDTHMMAQPEFVYEQERADCDFIAYARNHWTELLDELETLRKVARRSPISPLAHVDLVISQLRDGL